MRIRRIAAAVAVVVVAGVVAAAGGPPAPPRTTRPARQPAALAPWVPLRDVRDIVHVYHGVVMDAAMQPRSWDAKALPAVLDASARLLAKRAGMDVAPLDEARAELQKARLRTPAVDAALSGAVMRAAAQRAPKAMPPEIGWKLDYLRAQVLALPADKRLDAAAVLRALEQRPWYSSYFTDLSGWLRDPARFRPITRDGARLYADSCDRADVPLPPDWDRGEWTRQFVVVTPSDTLAEVPQELLFLRSGNPVEVWASNDRGRGACIALPRWGVGRATVTLGVICQSRTTGRACFWDNRPHAGGPTFTPAQMASNSVVGDWVNGNDSALVGGGKCVNCHRGGNAFVIHPGTPLALPADYQTGLPAGVRYAPLTALGWTNPPATAVPTLPAGQQSCVSCHEVGNTTFEQASYCSMLRQAANREMPSRAAPAGWGAAVPPSVPPDRLTNALWTTYINHLRAAERCAAAAPAL